jgi:hypothetical protein
MAAPSPDRTFGDLASEGLEVEVCQKCGHRAVLAATSPKLRDRRISGPRYLCSEPGCQGIGLPTIEKWSWVKRLARHAEEVHTRKP